MLNTIDPLLNEREAAHRLSLQVSTLRRWRWAGKGPRYLKIEGAIRYDPADILAFLQAARRHSTSDDRESTEFGEGA